MDRGEIILHDLVGGLLQAHALVLHEGADGARHGKPDEILACAGCRDSTRMIRSVGSSADDGGIANSVPALGRDAAGGGTGRDVAARAVLVRVRPFRCSDGLGRRRGRTLGARRNGRAVLFELADKILPAALGEKKGGGAPFAGAARGPSN